MNKAAFITSTTLLLSIGCGASEVARIRSKHIIASHELGRVTLRHDGSLFTVQRGKESHKVASYDTDQVLRQLNKINLARYLQNGRIRVSKLSDGSFILRSHIDGLGAGPLSGQIAYWVTKSLCYGTAAAAAGTAVAATGGAAGVVTSLAVTHATAGVSAGAGYVAAAIAGSGSQVLLDAAVGITIGAGSGGSIATTMGLIEGAAIGAGAFFTAIPFLP